MAVISTTNNQLYLHELQPPFDRLEIQFVPEELVWQRNGNWVNVPVVGRNNSRKHLTGGEDTLNLSLDFNGMFERDKQHCARKMAWINSLTYTDGYIGPPRNIKLIWGETALFRHKIWVVKSVSSRMSDFHSRFGMNPMNLLMDIQLELDPEENLRLNDVRIYDVNDYQAPASIYDFVNPPSNGTLA